MPSDTSDRHADANEQSHERDERHTLRVSDMARILNALAHPARLQIVHLLEGRQVPLDTLVRLMVPLTKTQVHRHVRVLEEAGIVGCGRKNYRGYYGLLEQDSTSVRKVIRAALESLEISTPQHVKAASPLP